MSHIILQDDFGDRQLGHHDHQVKLGSVTNDGFVLRTPKLLYRASFIPFGAIFTSKKTLMTVSSDTATSEIESDAGFVISMPDYLYDASFELLTAQEYRFLKITCKSPHFVWKMTFKSCFRYENGRNPKNWRWPATHRPR